MKGLKMNHGKLMMEYDDSGEKYYTYLLFYSRNFGLLIITYMVIVRNLISQTFSLILNKKSYTNPIEGGWPQSLAKEPRST